ncbi:MAG: hypothetical protein LAKADJCE_00932 [Candidatus Argoarchaeum ethanivorans]|uniref:MotA/TolQ/ExbB proton channel domain-containing protein n=1 Tax=Candidatus Argoarchaeum ethanivorans TaxID=2608793 RepID=A0A811TGA9_9EURY|nr:MAG: hypothetical protein LAKADJCE_00932 [Candidatus Argoarchaeum ethanivorans]
MNQSIFSIMYLVSSSLLYPVVIGLLALFVYSLFALGDFLSEYTRQQKTQIKKDRLDESKLNYFGSDFLTRARHVADVNELQWLIGECEMQMAHKLEHTRLLSTIGPILGLMGTLIPLGPALIGLAKGDVTQLADNLVIAFATTVLGLFAGGTGYLLTIVRKRWYAQELNDIEYISEVLSHETTQTK